MFGDDNYLSDIAEALLKEYSIEELLELNNLTEEEVLEILIEGGHIGYPRTFFERLEG